MTIEPNPHSLTAGEAPWPAASRAWWAVGVFCLAAILSYSDRQILSLLVDPIRRDLLISDTQVGLLIGTAFAFVYGLAGLPLGWLADRLRLNYPGLKLSLGSNDPLGFDIAINATPLGTYPDDPLPMDPSRLSQSVLVGEVVLKPETTAFLAAAKARGLACVTGLDMLFEQIPAYLEFFGFPSATAAELRETAKITS